jgi:hypothetical protein
MYVCIWQVHKIKQMQNTRMCNTVLYCTVYMTQGADPLPPFSKPVTAGRNHLNKYITRMRSSLVARASDCQCTSCNGPGFDPSIRRHSGI